MVCELEIRSGAYFRGESGWLVFIMTRLCANAEIGVPREELHVSDVASVPAVVSALSVIPPPPPVIPAKAGILIRLWTF